MNDNRAVIGVGSSGVSLISRENLDKNTPDQQVLTNPVAFRNNPNRSKPQAFWAEALAFTRNPISASALATPTPSQQITADRLIQEISYRRVNFETDPNYFRGTAALGQLNDLSHGNTKANEAELVMEAQNKKINYDLYRLRNFTQSYSPPNPFMKVQI
jgi:hypothetical protein